MVRGFVRKEVNSLSGDNFGGIISGLFFRGKCKDFRFVAGDFARSLEEDRVPEVAAGCGSASEARPTLKDTSKRHSSKTTMEKRVALEKRGLPDDQITELILDNCRSTNIEGLTDSFTALEVLSLINVGLTSLKNFPKLPALRKLELSDNRISNGISHLTGSPKLTHLNLSGNRIKDFDELKPLKELENLEVLDLFNNEVTATENYRDKIFELIPSLKYLDGFDREDTEAPSDEEDEANGGGEDDDEEDVELDDSSDYDEEDDNDISLADVYNDNLEEDGSDWNEEDGEGEDDIDEPTDDEEHDGEGDSDGEAGEGAEEKPSSDAEAEDAEARGKKRKHDGNDG